MRRRGVRFSLLSDEDKVSFPLCKFFAKRPDKYFRFFTSDFMNFLGIRDLAEIKIHNFDKKETKKLAMC